MEYPDRGGAAKFLLKGFGDGLLVGVLNVFQYLGWIGKAISIGIVILVVFINILGSKQVARAQTTIIAFELIVLIAFIAFGLTQAHVPTLSQSNSGSGLLGSLSAAGLLYVTYEGFGVVTNTAGSMKNPKKQLPVALFLSLGIVILIYIVASSVVISTIGVKLAVANQGHVLATAGQAVLGKIGIILIGLAALVATASAVNSTMFCDENLGIRISKVVEIPPKFGAITHFADTGINGIFTDDFVGRIFF